MASPTPVTLQRLQCLSALVAATTLLAACGGGSSAPPPPPPPPPPAATLSLTGTAATGAAIAGATVTAKCNGGTGTATTAANGTYSIALTAGALPCVLKVATTAGDLYSVATGTGTTATANITPFTQLIVANLTGKDPAAYFTDFGAADITALTSAVVTTAQVAVVTVLKNNGIDTSTLPTSLVAGSLVAASGSTAGNAYDVALDALKAKLTSSATTLAQLTTTVLQTATTAVPSGTPSVALDVALQPAAATCAALRSGIYRFVEPQIENPPNSGSSSTGTVTINATASATTVVVTEPNTSTNTLTAVSGAPCRFADAAGGAAVVSQAGVIAFRNADGSAGVVFPEQSIALVDLAGDWNFVSYDRSNLTDPLGPRATSGTVSSGGVLTVTNYCADAKTCVTTGLPTWPLTVNVAGGFNINFSTTEFSRMFAFRAGGGEIMLVGVSADGTFAFGTRRRTNGLPAVGAAFTGWNVGVNNVLVGTTYGPRGLAITESSNIVTSVDTVNGSFTRDNVTNVVGPVTRPETIFANAVAGNARQGYRWRQPATGVLNSAGATVNVPEFIDLPLRGMGMNASVFPNANLTASSFNISVTRPAP